MVHVSTISVLDAQDEMSLAQIAIRQGYSQSKWVAENLVRKAGQSTLDTYFYIVRPGLISWSAKTGAFNREDWLSRLLVSGIGLLSCVPCTDSSLRLVPVDFVALLISTFLVDENLALEANICGRSVKVNSLLVFLREYAQHCLETNTCVPSSKNYTVISNFAQLVQIPQDLWNEYLMKQLTKPSAPPELTYLLSFKKGISDSHRAFSWYSMHGLYPEVDISYAGKLINFIASQKD